LNNGFLKWWKLSPANSTGFRGFNRQAATVIRRLRDNDSDVFVDDDFFAYSAFQNEHDNLQFVWYIQVLGKNPTPES